MLSLGCGPPRGAAAQNRKLLPFAVAYWRASAYSGSGSLLDLSGNGHDAAFPGGSADPLFLGYTGRPYLYLPGSSGNSATVTLEASTAYDYTVTYSDGSTDTGTLVSDGSGVATFGGTDVKFAGLKVRSIDVTADGGGATLALFDASLVTPPYSGHTDTLGKVWTVNRSATGRKSTLVDRPVILFGTDDYLEVADHANLDFGDDVPFTVVIVFRGHAFASTGLEVFIGKKDAAGTSAVGWYIGKNNAQQVAQIRMSDGTNPVAPMSGTMPAGSTFALALVRTTTQATIYVDGAAGTPASDTTGNLSNTLPVRIGATSGATPGSFAEMAFVGAAVFRSALTPAELYSAGLELSV